MTRVTMTSRSVLTTLLGNQWIDKSPDKERKMAMAVKSSINSWSSGRISIYHPRSSHATWKVIWKDSRTLANQLAVTDLSWRHLWPKSRKALSDSHRWSKSRIRMTLWRRGTSPVMYTGCRRRDFPMEMPTVLPCWHPRRLRNRGE